MTIYRKHTPRSLHWKIIAVIDTERQRLANVYWTQSGPAREATEWRVAELSVLLRQAIRGSVR